MKPHMVQLFQVGLSLLQLVMLCNGDGLCKWFILKCLSIIQWIMITWFSVSTLKICERKRERTSFISKSQYDITYVQNHNFQTTRREQDISLDIWGCFSSQRYLSYDMLSFESYLCIQVVPLGWYKCYLISANSSNRY